MENGFQYAPSSWNISNVPRDSMPVKPGGDLDTKPDALSRIHAPESDSSDPEPILPETCIVGAFTWSVEGKVTEALRARTP